MTGFQVFMLLLSLAAVAIGWLKGGRTERDAVVLTMLAYLFSNLFTGVRVGDFRLGEAVVDGLLLAALVWLAMRRDRWWVLAAVAALALTMVMHGAMVLAPELTSRADVSARWGLNAIYLMALIAGVLERWLAGEPPASRTARWTPRRERPSKAARVGSKAWGQD